MAAVQTAECESSSEVEYRGYNRRMLSHGTGLSTSRMQEEDIRRRSEPIEGPVSLLVVFEGRGGSKSQTRRAMSSSGTECQKYHRRYGRGEGGKLSHGDPPCR